MGHYRLTSCLVASTLITMGCEALDRELTIKVSAKTPSGEPVAGAIISIDGKMAGETNAYGAIQLNASFRPGSRHQISVTKSDEKYYFAPHVESLKISNDTSREIAVNSVMYLVPKPKKPLLSELNHNVVASGKMGEIPQGESPKGGFGAAREPLPPLSEIPEHRSAMTAQRDESTPSLATVHVYAGRLPLAAAKVTWLDRNSRILCVSNDRGRCALDAPLSMMGHGTLIISADGYMSELVPAPVKDKENIRVSLKPGSNVVIRVAKKSLWDTVPVAGAKIQLPRRAFVTGDFGLSAFIPDTNQETIQVSIPGSTALRSLSVSDLDTHDINEIPFATTADLGWKKINIEYPRVHPSASALLSEPMPLTEIFESLNQATRAVGGNLAEDHAMDKPDELRLIPVVIKDGGHYSVSVYNMNGQNGREAGTRMTLANAALGSSWKETLAAALTSAIESSPAPGIIVKASSGEFEFATKGRLAKSSARESLPDTIALASPGNIVTTTGVRKSDLGFLVSIQAAHTKSFAKPWSMIGAPVHYSTARSSGIVDLTSYPRIDQSFALTRQARKHLAEGDTDGALSALGAKMAADTPSTVLNLRQQILLESGRLTELERDMFSIIKSRHADLDSPQALVAEVNILRIQAESLPVLPNDKSLIERCGEIIERAAALDKSMSSATDLTSINLRFAAHLASRKRAQAADDLIALATIKSNFESLESRINAVPDTTPWKSSWARSAAEERKRLDFFSDSDSKQKM